MFINLEPRTSRKLEIGDIIIAENIFQEDHFYQVINGSNNYQILDLDDLETTAWEGSVLWAKDIEELFEVTVRDVIPRDQIEIRRR